MVTFLRPFPHAHGPAAVNVRLRRSQHHQPSSLLPCRGSNLKSMAQDPSHPHRQSKEHDTPPTTSQQELTQQLPPAPSPPPRDVQEPSTSSSSGSSSDTSSWLKLGIGQSPGSPSPSSSARRKRPRNDYEAGPSTSVQPTAPPPELGLSLFPAGSSSPSAAAAVASGVVVASAPPPVHEAGTWFVLHAAQNQRREPPLPPIPRSYLRVRDGRITVSVVMSYLVNKLGLEDDSQFKVAAPILVGERSFGATDSSLDVGIPIGLCCCCR
ncbi:hypothetical protein QYE76_002326 [Lolium multiflorum]|uniref:Uncharacterized protein n=1 Tax=Lolium multiflorum TaxID=4521 RepID=A0AAD8RLG3_LOLMU|nr:hypothetical protein QYE76_002326 [Lolium multiflorum]